MQDFLLFANQATQLVAMGAEKFSVLLIFYMLYKGVRPGQILQPADPMKEVLPLLNKIATNDLHGLADSLQKLNDKYERHDKQAGRIETKQAETKEAIERVELSINGLREDLGGANEKLAGIAAHCKIS